MKQPTMTLDELLLHPLWKQLTTKQQVFLTEYIKSRGNTIEAAHAAFDVTTDSNADFMGRRLLKTPVVRKLLAEYYGYDVNTFSVSKTELIALISQRLRSGTLSDRAFENLTERLMDLRGWAQPKRKLTKPGKVEDECATELTDVDELVRKLEQEGR